MNTNFERATWASKGYRLAHWIGSAITTMKVAMERLNAYQFDAPWKGQCQTPCS